MAVLCGNCSGKLIFNPASQKLECVSCGSKFRPEDVKDVNAEAHSKYYDTRVYVCGHCGAEVVTSDTEVSTFCVYCGNPAIVFSRISREYRPDGLIPFKVTKEEAIRNIRSKFIKNPIVPQAVKNKLTPENLRGIYIPYWIINADYTEADFLSGEVQHGKRRTTEYFTRAGEVSLKNIPIDGSDILNDDTSRKLEPFYLENAVDFDEDYLNGFYSNTTDLTYKDLRRSAAERCHKLFEEEVVESVTAENVKIQDTHYWVDIHDDPIYMMMPVWFFTFRHEDTPYTILVNGQSGKVVGTMPFEKKRIVALAVISFILIAVLLALLVCGTLFCVDLWAFIAAAGLLGISAFSIYALIRSIIGIRKLSKNLKLTQSESMFRYVRRRQG